MPRFRKWAVAVSLGAGLVCGGVAGANAQDMPSIVLPASPTAPTAPAAPVKPTALVPATQQSTQAPLDQLVAPIALYPDSLLGQVLMASTYPQEVGEAARWVRVPTNRALNGDALISALKARGWAPSVMALMPFPGLLATIAEKADWTEQLGKAFRTQQGDVMAAVQRLRHAAQAAGNLKATPECHCVIHTSGDIISIRPSEAELVSIPVYNPAVAFGNRADAAYPPVAFPAPSGFVLTPGTTVGFNPAIEVALFGPIWGWGSIDWADRRIVVDNARYAALAPGHAGFAGGVWVHEAPPHKLARILPAMATHSGHHAKALAMRRLAMMPPPGPYPPYWWPPRYRAWELPPGMIVPPPPRHVARDWYDDYYDRYR